MKRYIIPIFAALSVLGAQAQLNMPDNAPDAMPDNMPQTQQAPDSATVAGSAQAKLADPKYNTPSKSYKAERNDIRSGNRFFEKEKYHEALKEYNKALEYNGGSIRAKYNKAVTLVQLASDDNKGTQNDPRMQAGALFEQLIPDAKQYDPEIAQKSFYNLGNMAFNDEQYDRAIAMYKSSLRMKPDDMDARENLRLAQLKKQEQENQDQNQQEQQQDKQDQQQEQQQDQQQQQEQQQQQQQQPPKPEKMTQSAQQILQSMQNKENQTRKKVKEEEQPAGRPQTDKPW